MKLISKFDKKSQLVNELINLILESKKIKLINYIMKENYQNY